MRIVSKRSSSGSVCHGATRRKVNAMYSGLSPTHERATTLVSDRQAVSVRLGTCQKAKEGKPPNRSSATSLLIRILYWIYEWPRVGWDCPDASRASWRPPGLLWWAAEAL